MNKYFLIIFLPLFLISCGAADGFKLKKKSSADEFLVEKKSPLVLPPDYGKLPTPGDNQSYNDESNEDSFEKTISKKKNSNKSEVTNSTSIEKSVLDKIK